MNCYCRLPSCGPARYRWTFATSGNTVDLCKECCVAFRARAVAEPDLGASRIVLMDDGWAMQRA